MRGKALLIGAGLLSIAIAGTLYGQLENQQPELSAAADAPDSPSAEPESPSPPTAAEQRALLLNPAVRTQEQRLAFHQAYRGFVAGAAQLSPQQRLREARALSEQIATYEQRSELAMSESLVLQLGLIQLTTDDEQAQKEQAAALVARYQALSAEREAQAKAPSAEFQRYKSEEKRIVAEVMDLESLPDGVSRDEYLRQRLQQAREQHYQ